MIKVFLIIILLGAGHQTWAQVYFQDQPDSSYFTQIQLARFPEVNKNREGIVFFKTDNEYFYRNTRKKAAYVFKQLSHMFYKYPQGDKRIRYQNFRYELDDLEYFPDTSMRRDAFTDTAYCTIYADRTRRYWSWRYLKWRYGYEQTETIYQAKVFSHIALDPKARTPARRLDVSRLGIEVSMGDSTIYSYTYDQDQCFIERYLYFRFDDRAIQEWGVSGRLDFNRPTIELKNFKEVLFYFPVQIRRTD